MKLPGRSTNTASAKETPSKRETAEEDAVLRPGKSTTDLEPPILHLEPTTTLSDALRRTSHSQRLSQRLNTISTAIVNSYSARAAFPTSERLIRREIRAPPEIDLEEWARSVDLTLGSLIPDDSCRRAVLELLYTYQDLNGTNLKDLPATTLITHKVRLTPGTKPHSVKSQKRWSPQMEWWMRKLIQEGMDGGIFESTLAANGRLSPWNARIVMVDKVENPTPQDEPRLTINYRNLPEELPGVHLESMARVHDHLSDPRHQCLMQADLKHAYYSVLLDPDCRHFFSFFVPGLGQLQPTRMPQGSKSSGFTMTELTTILLGPIPSPNPEFSLLHSPPNGKPGDPPTCVYYQDDIFGGHPSFDAQFAFLRDQFLPRIAWGNLRLSFKKLKLFQPSIKALGIRHTVCGLVNITYDRIKRIIQWPTPKNATGVRAFMGAIKICRRWIKNFSEIARPLCRLTGKMPFHWGEPEQLAFEILRIKGATTLWMHGYDSSLPVHFYSDASKFCGGLCITQFQTPYGGGKPIEVPLLFDSFPFSATEVKYPTYKRELFVMVKFALKYDYFLRDPRLPGILHTDHKPLSTFLTTDIHDGIYGTWASKLQTLHCKIQYIPGRRNGVADGLSRTVFSGDCDMTDLARRLKEECEKHANDHKWYWKDGPGGFQEFLEKLSDTERAEVIDEGTLAGVNVFSVTASITTESPWDSSYSSSPHFHRVYAFLRHGTHPTDLPMPALRRFYRTALHYTTDPQGILWKNHRDILLPCIPESRVPEILHEAHDRGGHWAAEATLAKLRRHCFWPNMSTDVQNYIQSCLPCARHGPALRVAALHPIRPLRPLILFGMDFIGPLKKTSRNAQYILHVIDYFSRYSWAYPTENANFEDVVACLKTLFSHIPHPHGFYIDRGQHFDNDRLRLFLKELHIGFELSPSGSSKSTGMVEKGNDILQLILRKSREEWDLTLPPAIKNLNARVIPHLRFSPLEILFGIPFFPLASQSFSQIPPNRFAELHDALTDRARSAAAVASFVVERAQRREKAHELSNKRKDQEERRYNLGRAIDKPLVGGDLVMLHQKSPGKLEPRWRGPFRVSGPGGTHGRSFTIRQRNGRLIRGTFHRDDLKFFKERPAHLRYGDEELLPPQQTIRLRKSKAKAPK